MAEVYFYKFLLVGVSTCSRLCGIWVLIFICACIRPLSRESINSDGDDKKAEQSYRTYIEFAGRNNNVGNHILTIRYLV